MTGRNNMRLGIRPIAQGHGHMPGRDNRGYIASKRLRDGAFRQVTLGDVNNPESDITIIPV